MDGTWPISILTSLPDSTNTKYPFMQPHRISSSVVWAKPYPRALVTVAWAQHLSGAGPWTRNTELVEDPGAGRGAGRVADVADRRTSGHHAEWDRTTVSRCVDNVPWAAVGTVHRGVGAGSPASVAWGACGGPGRWVRLREGPALEAKRLVGMLEGVWACWTCPCFHHHLLLLQCRRRP